MSSNAGVGEELAVPVQLLQYRDLSIRKGWATGSAASNSCSHIGHGVDDCPEPQRISEMELEARVAKAKAEVIAEMEPRLRTEYEQRLQAAREPIARTVEAFEAQKSEYFAQVEAEVIQLALAIARKILHREAQVDPMLVASLVRIALEKMREGSSVIIRVGQGRAANWRTYFAGVPALAEVDVVEEAHLTELDCVVETELGSANFGLDAQLKEVEQGFFDLLALRPAGR